MKMKKNRKHREWRPAFGASMDLFGYVIDENQKVKEGVTRRGVELRWRKVFGTVLKYLGFPKDARAFMWDELVNGNWSRIHPNEEEQRKSPEQWLEDLAWDVFYCSDRYSLDRLTRCHWCFRQYMRSTIDRLDT